MYSLFSRRLSRVLVDNDVLSHSLLYYRRDGVCVTILLLLLLLLPLFLLWCCARCTNLTQRAFYRRSIRDQKLHENKNR